MTTELEEAIAELSRDVERGEYSGGGYRYIEADPEALRTVLAALSTPPADDVRKALEGHLRDAVRMGIGWPKADYLDRWIAEKLDVVISDVRPRGTVTDALYCAHCQNDDHASSACEARGTVTAPGLRCPACGWSTSNREAEQHVCPGPSYATALRAIANGDGPRFVREFARDTLEAEPQVRPRGAVTDAPRVLADPKGGCACEPFDQDAGGGHIEHLLEYEPDCPVHSTHLYDPRIGQWIMREKFEAARGVRS